MTNVKIEAAAMPGMAMVSTTLRKSCTGLQPKILAEEKALDAEIDKVAAAEP